MLDGSVAKVNMLCILNAAVIPLYLNCSTVFTGKAVSLCNLLSNHPVGFWLENFLKSHGFVRNNDTANFWEQRGFPQF